MSKAALRAPRGTRDYYPAEMAVRLHIENAWREASIRNGFEEIEGPNFEHLDLYTLKSGPGIVSELFSFRREGGDDTYALRPEFTPTIARMVASKGGGLQRPIKWFAIPSHFRAERPQRGRGREFRQWNVDMLGMENESADAEVIATAISALVALGLGPESFRVKVSHRDAVAAAMGELGVSQEKMTGTFELLDRRDKLDPEEFARRAKELGMEKETIDGFDRLAKTSEPITTPLSSIAKSAGVNESVLGPMEGYRDALENAGIAEFCDWDLSIVRGLAYYTGGVFEIRDAAAKERAIAGGGRYDGLVEMLGGTPTSAVGFGMGDMVISLVLEEHGLLEGITPSAPEVFLVCAGDEDVLARMTATMQQLRQSGIHTRRSYRSTQNVSKLLGEAAKSGAKVAIIFGEECARGEVVVKNLSSAEQETVRFEDLEVHLRRMLAETTS
jgi:histidyl-tRNA synthetase